MIINSNTRVGAVISHNPQAIEALASISPHFNKLKNPVLRRVLAPRVTIAEAAAIGKCPVETILDKLAGIGFAVERSTKLTSEKISDSYVTDKIELAVSYDAREDLSRGVDPLAIIMEKLSSLEKGKTMLVINSFEPVPLVRLLTSKGYTVSVVHPQPDVVYTYITRTTDNASLKDINVTGDENFELFDQVLHHPDLRFIEIDVRGLTIPQPMVTILDKLNDLKSGEALYVHHKKIPVYLLPELKERDFNFVYKQTGNEVIILIYPASFNN